MNEESVPSDLEIIAFQYASALAEVYAQAAVVLDSLTTVSSILEKDCPHKELYDTISISMQQILSTVQVAIANSEIDEFTVLH